MTFAPPVRALRMIFDKSMASLEKRLHGAILIARSHGELDLANKLSEMLHWQQCRYNPELLPKLLQGVKPFPKAP